VKPDIRQPNLSAPRALNDLPMMLLGIPAFGIAIPLLSGLYGRLGPGDGAYWFGFFYFVALSAAIWLGNRWLLLRQRDHLDWFAQPARKLMMLVGANVLYTAPLTLASLAAWYALRGEPVDKAALELVALTNVICVVFVTHAYETVFLIREREDDRVRVERLERSRAEGELAALNAQLDPHFLFNSLNTLGHVIAHDAELARDFCDRLAEVYRYVLACRGRSLVELQEELEFIGSYFHLLSSRFGAALALKVDDEVWDAAFARHHWLPPLALQTLLENAVKHNQFDAGEPLSMHLALCGESVRFGHAQHPRSSLRPGSGLGLPNLDERCRLTAGRALEVTRSGGRFEVVVPLVRA
jgi:hypothetical protein